MNLAILMAQDCSSDLVPPHINIPGDINTPFDINTQMGNLVPNGSFNLGNYANWNLDHDCTASWSGTNPDYPTNCDLDTVNIKNFQDGSRCIAFDKKIDPVNVPGGQYAHDRAISDPIDIANAISQEESFTVSFKAKTIDTWPSPLTLLRVLDVTQNQVILEGTSLFSTSFKVSQNNVWQECVAHIKIDPSVTTHIRIELISYTRISGQCRTVYIDDVYMGVGKHYDNPPACKEPFNSSEVKIDELGNIFVYESGSFQQIFPIGIMGGNYRFSRDNTDGIASNDYTPEFSDNDRHIYAEKGFNMRCRLTALSQVQESIASGLPWYSFGLTHWVDDINICKNWPPLPDGVCGTDSDVDKWDKLLGNTRGLDTINNANLLDNLLYYYIDNEQHIPTWWHSIARAVDTVKHFERSLPPHYEQLHPIYLLNGTYGIARQYKAEYPDYTGFGTEVVNAGECNVNVCDMTGTYIGRPSANSFPTFKYDLINNLDDQKIPVSIAQINSIRDNSMGARLFAAIAHGAKGMNYWTDTSPGDYGYIPDFPNCHQLDDVNQTMVNCPGYDYAGGLLRNIYDHLNLLDATGNVVDASGQMLFEEDGTTPLSKRDDDGDSIYSTQLYNDVNSRKLDINNKFLEQPPNPNDPFNPFGPILPTNDITLMEWWDGPDTNPINGADGFQHVVEDINALLPLIKEPHWTDWTASHDAGCGIDFGTRNLNGEGYLIVANLENDTKVVNFTIENLGYVPGENKVDRHSSSFLEGLGWSPTAIANDQSSFKVFTYLEPFGYGVFRLTNDNSCSSNTIPTTGGLTAKQFCNPNRIRFWETAVEADNYQFRYSLRRNGIWGAWTNSSTTTNGIKNIYNIPNGTNGAKVRVRIQCGSTWSGWSDVKVFNLPTCILGPIIGGNRKGINIDYDQIEVYPNPANQYVTIFLEDNEFETGSITIYNLAGKQVQLENLKANQIFANLNVETLSNGVYLIKITTDGEEIHTQKLTIAH